MTNSAYGYPSLSNGTAVSFSIATYFHLQSTSVYSLMPPPPLILGDFYQGHWFASPWHPQLLKIPQNQHSSALFELYPVVTTAILWGDKWSTSSILVHCDNEGTVQCINKGRSHSPPLLPLLRCLVWTSAKRKFIMTVKDVPGCKNQIADSFSCFSFQKFQLLAEVDSHPTPVPP